MWVIFSFLQLFLGSCNNLLYDLNIPPEHLTYVFNAFPNIANSCKQAKDCPFKDLENIKSCWGYEPYCDKSESYHVKPECPGDHRGWVKTKQAQYDTFYTQADFGEILYIISTSLRVNPALVFLCAFS